MFMFLCLNRDLCKKNFVVSIIDSGKEGYIALKKFPTKKKSLVRPVVLKVETADEN